MKAENAAAEVEALDPWDWQPGETPKAYRAFALYRNLGAERSLAKVAQMLHVTVQNLTRWSGRSNWVERCMAYDAEVARRATAIGLEDHVAVNARHAELGRTLQAKGAERMATIKADRLSATEAVSAVKAGVQVERDALGMATRTEVTGKDGAPLVPPQPPIICRPALPDEMPEE